MGSVVELSGEAIIKAPQARVYNALHDPVTLRQTLPGCQSFTTAGGKSSIATLVKVGPIRATVHSTVEVFNEDPPAGYSLYAIANAGSAGSGAGTAHVALAEVDADTTSLAYHLSADLDGQIAELDEDVIDSTARTLIAEFISRLQLVVEPQPVADNGEAKASGHAAARDDRTAPGSASLTPDAATDRDAAFATEDGAETRVAEPQQDAVGGTSPADLGEARVWSAARPEPTRSSARSRGAGEEGMASWQRWLLVAVGIAIIIYLLSGGIGDTVSFD